MKRYIVVHSIAVWFVISSLSGCAMVQAASSDKMYVLSSALTKLSAAVESTVRYKNPPEGIDDSELIALSTQHDRGLIEPFTDYTVRVSRQDKHAIVLVCDKGGKIGLLEDAGCSSEMDSHLWQENPPKPCEFTLKAKDACPQAATK